MTDGEALNSGNNKKKKWNKENGNENKNTEEERTRGKRTQRRNKVIKDPNTESGRIQ